MGTHTPVLFTAVAKDALHGNIFVQEAKPDTACYGCLFTDAVHDQTFHPCSPSVTDILKVMGGIVSYAVDSLLMPRPRLWNFKSVYLSSGDDMAWKVERRKDCALCGTPHDHPQSKEGRV